MLNERAVEIQSKFSVIFKGVKFNISEFPI